jgi:hypothetical protein
MKTRYNIKRADDSGRNATAKFTISQEGHPNLGKAFDFEQWEGIMADPGAKSSPLKGSGLWVTTYTMAASEDAKATIEGVPWSETERFCAFVGQGNGPANTTGTLEVTLKLPGITARSITLSNFRWENCGKMSIKSDGSVETAEGPFTSMLVNGIDPIAQDF